MRDYWFHSDGILFCFVFFFSFFCLNTRHAFEILRKSFYVMNVKAFTILQHFQFQRIRNRIFPLNTIYVLVLYRSHEIFREKLNIFKKSIWNLTFFHKVSRLVCSFSFEKKKPKTRFRNFFTRILQNNYVIFFLLFTCFVWININNIKNLPLFNKIIHATLQYIYIRE